MLRKDRYTWQCFPKTRSAYWGSLRSWGHSGSPRILALAAFQIEEEERLIRRARRSFEVRAKCSRSSGSRRPKTWFNNGQQVHVQRIRNECTSNNKSNGISTIFLRIPRLPRGFFGWGCPSALPPSTLLFLALGFSTGAASASSCCSISSSSESSARFFGGWLGKRAERRCMMGSGQVVKVWIWFVSGIY